MAHREPNLHVLSLDRTNSDEVAALLGRGMADNPMHVAVYGDDRDRRSRHHARLMRTLLMTSSSMRVEGVRQGDSLIGVLASTPPSHCRPALATRTRILRTALRYGPGVTSRLLLWERGWARHDLAEPHIHLGPVAVDPSLRGRGIGGLLMLRHVGSLDSVAAVGYLETDRPEAVGFYRKWGYAVVETAEILGVRAWFMRRPPA